MSGSCATGNPRLDADFAGVFEEASNGDGWAIALRFMQSLGDPRRVRLLDHLGSAPPATLEQCTGVERAAVWDAKLIEERHQRALNELKAFLDLHNVD